MPSLTCLLLLASVPLVLSAHQDDDVAAYAQPELQPRFLGTRLQLPRLPVPKLPGLPGLPQIPNLPALLQVLQGVRTEISNQAKGQFNFNDTLYKDLVTVCDVLLVATKDFDFYSTNNICPNMTNLLNQAGGLMSAGVDVGVDAAVAVLILLQRKTNCDQDNKADGLVCYAQMLPGALRTLNILLGTLRQTVASARHLSQGIIADWDYCQNWKKLNNADRQAVLQAWRKQDNDTCTMRAQAIMNRQITDLSKTS